MKNVVLAGVVFVALLEAISFRVAAEQCGFRGCSPGQRCVPDEMGGHCVPVNVESPGPYKPSV
ncbi:hypothetical protein AAVH_10311, partial [Aphelenchoides avenae]